MTLTQVDVQNKESRENKFLSDRIIQRALDCGEIDSVSVGEITELFQAVFSQHKGDTARARAEALMFTLRGYIANKEKEQKEGGSDELQKLQEDRFVAENNEEEKELLKKIINKKIIDSDLPEKLHEEAGRVILEETSHIIGTGVNARVFEMSVIKALEIFKQKYERQEKKVIEPKEKEEINTPTSPEETASLSADENIEKKEKLKEEEEESKEIKKNENESDALAEVAIIKDPVFSQSLKEFENRSAEKRKLSLTEAILQKAREDDINNPLKPNTLHWPTATISFGTPVRKTDPAADPAVSSNTNYMDNDIINNKFSSTKDQDDVLRLTKVEQVDKQKQEVNSETTEFKKPEKEQGLPQKTQPKARSADNQTPQDLSSASNTKMVFDADLELNGSSIEAKHSLSKQNEMLFDKYINEQINNTMEVVAQSNALTDDILKKIRDDLNNQAIDISKNTNISIKERIQRLDAFFEERKKEYVIKKVDNDFDSKDLIEDIIKRSEKEIDTGDQEADARFRKTLRNTLFFKVRHFVGSDMNSDLISTMLNEEYVKHKSFYTKKI